MDFKVSKLFGISDLNKLKDLLKCDLEEYKSTKHIYWNHYQCRIINNGKRLVEEPDEELKKIQKRINAVDPIKVLVYGWKLVDYPEKLGPEGQFYSPIIWESVNIYSVIFLQNKEIDFIGIYTR